MIGVGTHTKIASASPSRASAGDTTARPLLERRPESVVRHVVDRRVVGVELGDATGEGVDAGHGQARLGERDGQRQADIAEADDGDVAVRGPGAGRGSDRGIRRGGLGQGRLHGCWASARTCTARNRLDVGDNCTRSARIGPCPRCTLRSRHVDGDASRCSSDSPSSRPTRSNARSRSTRQAEAAGFEYGWLFDSHVLWRDPYPLLTLMAGVTERMRLGTCVTNPGTREPSVTASVLATLDEISGGRMDLGIGRGDSARRVLGKRPITMADTEEAIGVIRTLVAGEPVTYEGTELHFPWTTGWTLPDLGRRLWSDGAVDDRADRRRRHPPAGRSGPHPLVLRPGPRRRCSGRARSVDDQGPGRSAGPHRAAGPGTRADPLVPCPCLQPRRSTSSRSTRARISRRP